MANPSTPQEQKIQQHRERLERLRSIQIGKQGAQNEPASPKVIVAQAVKREYPTLPYDEVQKATRELVLAPRKATVKVGKEEIPVEDLQFKIAESIEIINSETTSSQEYFSWFEDCAEIMRNMNDGYISDSDLNDRNEWISYSYTREAEIMTCLALYQNSTFPEAKKKYDDLYNKLVKLRQIRNAIKEGTASHSDETRDRTRAIVNGALDLRKAAVYLAAMREFQKHGERWNMPRNTLRKLRMYRGDDDDLYGEYDWFYGDYDDPAYDEVENDDNEYRSGYYGREQYSFDDKLKEYVLFHWDDNDYSSPVYSKAEDMLSRQPQEDRQEDDIKTRIAILSGRRPPLKDSGLGAREDRARSFDAAKFQMLSSSKLIQNS